MFKDFLALYGFLKLLDDAADSQPSKNDNDNSGCGCLLVTAAILILVSSVIEN